MTQSYDAIHHVPQAIMQAYAAGTLSEAFSLVVACHASLCDQCRAEIAGHEAVGGAVIDAMPKADLPGGLLVQTMAAIKSTGGHSTVTVAPTAKDPEPSVFPTPLRHYVGAGPDAVRWRRVGAGIKQAILPCAGEASVRLIKIPAGMAMPDHSHEGQELTLVLSGAFADDTGRFQRGDVEFGDEHMWHVPVAETGQDCICLTATTHKLRFRGLVPRMMQPYLDI